MPRQIYSCEAGKDTLTEMIPACVRTGARHEPPLSIQSCTRSFHGDSLSTYCVPAATELTPSQNLTQLYCSHLEHGKQRHAKVKRVSVTM